MLDDPDEPDWWNLDEGALLDILFGPPTIPPGDGASAPMPGQPWRDEGLGSADPIDDLDDSISTN